MVVGGVSIGVFFDVSFLRARLVDECGVWVEGRLFGRRSFSTRMSFARAGPSKPKAVRALEAIGDRNDNFNMASGKCSSTIFEAIW